MIIFVLYSSGLRLKFKFMWVIKHNGFLWAEYLERMEEQEDGMHIYFNAFGTHAFRFPDEQTAQAVLKFLNRDNLEVVCID